MKTAKAIVAGVAAFAGLVSIILSDDAISAAEIGEMVAFVAGALGVYWVPNKRT